MTKFTMEKTALTMTGLEKLGAEKFPELSGSQPMTPKEENKALRIIIEEQEIALDMIMRKYREHVDSLIKVPRSDVWKLYHKRFLNTIINQANKMDEMTKTMRKNLSIIFKYEEVMSQMEAENESLRALVKELTLAVKEAERKSHGKVMKNDEGCQTVAQWNAVSSTDKSVGTEKPECENPRENGVQASEKRDKCTDMIPYTPISDRLVYFGTIHGTPPMEKPLDLDAAFDLYVNRLVSKETENPALESASHLNVTSTEIDGDVPSELLEVSEDSSEDLESSTRASMESDVDEISSENSITSLIDDSCSKEDHTEEL